MEEPEPFCRKVGSLEALTENEFELVKNYRAITDEAKEIILANVRLAP